MSSNSFTIQHSPFNIEHSLSRRSRALHDHRQSHPAADAEGGQAEFLVVFAQCMKKRRGDARAGASDRMAEGDGATVNVELRAIEVKIALAGDHLRRERFVQFD